MPVGPSAVNGSRVSRALTRSQAPTDSDISDPNAHTGSEYKRLIVASDGTWLNADSGKLRDNASNPSNVVRLSRSIRSVSRRDGVPQIVYYHYGVGSQGGIVDRIYGGVTGNGLAENVREGYEFIATNWSRGDEIFLLGFSRGAFTARAIAGLIDVVGILTRQGIQYLGEIFRDVQHRHDPDYRPKHPNVPFRNKPNASDPRYRAELERRGLAVLNVSVKAVAVWDTVGSLGTPRIGWLEKIGIQSSATKRMSFYDTRLSKCIENAFQALALDEKRAAFSPSLWEKSQDSERTRLRQVWFAGVHENVGGGYPDQELANISLVWMASQLRDFLDFDLDYILDFQEKNEAYYEKQNERPREWSFGRIYNSMAGLYAIGGERTRTPGRYYVIDPENGRETNDPLMDTHEYVHPSVRTRIKLNGPGLNNRGTYSPQALKDWRLVIEEPEDGSDGRSDVYWQLKSNQKNVSTRVLPESPLWPLERELLEMSADPDTEEYVLDPPVQRNTPKRARNRNSRTQRA